MRSRLSQHLALLQFPLEASPLRETQPLPSKWSQFLKGKAYTSSSPSRFSAPFPKPSPVFTQLPNKPRPRCPAPPLPEPYQSCQPCRPLSGQYFPAKKRQDKEKGQCGGYRIPGNLAETGEENLESRLHRRFNVLLKEWIFGGGGALGSAGDGRGAKASPKPVFSAELMRYTT